MIGRHRRAERGNGTATVAVVPVVLPRVEVRPDGDDRMSVSVDGDAHPDSPMRRNGLGDALTRIAHEQGSAIRVEVHDADGMVYADIIDPPPQVVAPDPDETEASEGRAIGVEVSAGGFLPGEPVHIVVAVSTETADSAGRLTAVLDPTDVDDEALVVVLGAVSGVTIVQERS